MKNLENDLSHQIEVLKQENCAISEDTIPERSRPK